MDEKIQEVAAYTAVGTGIGTMIQGTISGGRHLASGLGTILKESGDGVELGGKIGGAIGTAAEVVAVASKTIGEARDKAKQNCSDARVENSNHECFICNIAEYVD